MAWLALAGLGGLALVLYGEVRGYGWAQMAGKPLASLAFLVAGVLRWQMGGFGVFGGLICAGLAGSVIGDLCLLSRGTGRVFLAGMAAFLLAHLCYICAFLIHGVRWEWAGFVVPPLAVVGAVILHLLRPRLSGAMRWAVPVYLLAVSGMLATALMAVLPAFRPWTLGGGAVLFFLSDALVARQRFLSPSPVNRITGLPLYYGGQWLLLLTIPGAG